MSSQLSRIPYKPLIRALLPPYGSSIRALSTASETQIQKLHRIADDLLSLNKLERHDYAILFKHKIRSNAIGPANSGVVSASGPSVAGPKLLFDRYGAAFFETVSAPGGSGGGAEAAAGAAEVESAEKTAFDVKLEKFDAAAKIKVIKEVRGFTALGLKEAKDLVEKTPVVLKKGVTKEEAEAIVEKLKGIGATAVLE